MNPSPCTVILKKDTKQTAHYAIFDFARRIKSTKNAGRIVAKTYVTVLLLKPCLNEIRNSLRASSIK